MMRWARSDIDQSHVALTLLLVVLGGSAGGGRALGFALAILGFLIIDYVFQAPYGHISVGKPLDWVVLMAFLSAAFVATELMTSARREAEEARQRGNEIAALGEERLRLAREADRARTLQEENRAKDEVLASVSHDLRAPLTAIKLLAQSARARGDPSGCSIEEEVDRLSGFVTNILDLSRIRAEGITLDFEVNAAEDLIGAAIIRATPLLKGRTIVPHIDLSAPVLTASFDFVQSLRIVANLLDNALRYTPGGGSVDVQAIRDGSWIAISVSDRGPGVESGERERIFEPFYRPRSEMPDVGHAGLGLSIARQLAELQGGTLTYEPRQGGGSTFTLRVRSSDQAPL
jgi:two-component system sensor histidine kinase KdpD